MRDEILTELTYLWKRKFPTLRFFQFMYTMESEFSEANHGAGRIENSKGVAYDLFHVEDEKFLEFLKSCDYSPE